MSVYEVMLERGMYANHVILCGWCREKFGPQYNMYINERSQCSWEFETMFGTSYFMFYNKQFAEDFISHLETEYNYFKYVYKKFENDKDKT